MSRKAPGGKLSFSVEASIRSSPSKAWEALTDMDQLSRWFCTRANIEAKAGAPFEFHFERDGFVDEGEVLAVQKNKLVKLRVAGGDGRTGPPEMTVTWKLAKEGAGTKVVLEQEVPMLNMDACKMTKDSVVPWGFYVHNLKTFLEQGVDERGGYWHKNGDRI